MTFKIRVEVDYNGNTYLNYGGRYYNIYFDPESETGVEISSISDQSYDELSSIYTDHTHLAQYVIRGKIVLSDSTLRGRAAQVLAELDPEELEDELEQNMLNGHHVTYPEQNFFRIERLDGDVGENDDWDIMDNEDRYSTSNDLEYRFSGVEENEKNEMDNYEDGVGFVDRIFFARVLSELPAHNDTLMIRGDRNGKVVTSCVQRTDGFCTRRLVFYSESGIIKVHYSSSHSVWVRVQSDGTNLSLEMIDRKDD